LVEYELEERLNKLKLRVMEPEFEYKITQEKDKSLKSLFEVKKQFIELLKTFVKESWVEKLNEENIELADKEFIMQNIHETTADLIYRVKDEEIYFILLEFQSTEDESMPYRLLSYMLEIWRRYKKEKLPLVIPCVLYTGNKKWKVKTLRSLFDVREELEKYIPDFQYILIDVNNYTDEELIETSNLVSSVVYMAKSKDKKEVANKLENVIILIRRLDEKEQKTFIRWAEVMFFKYENVYECFEEKIYNKKEEKEMALADLVPGALELIKERARAGQLKKILTKKIGSEPGKNLFEDLSEGEINKIEDKIFEINSWEEVEEIIK